MTTFKYILMQCGLSHREAAQFLNVADETINSWSSGRRNPPEGVFHELAALQEKIRDLAYEKAEKIIDNNLAVIEPRFYTCWEIDSAYDCLPCEGSRKAAGALAFLLAIGTEDND